MNERCLECGLILNLGWQEHSMKDCLEQRGKDKLTKEEHRELEWRGNRGMLSGPEEWE